MQFLLEAQACAAATYREQALVTSSGCHHGFRIILLSVGALDGIVAGTGGFLVSRMAVERRPCHDITMLDTSGRNTSILARPVS